MKLYRKQIRPMIDSPAPQGCNNEPIPFFKGVSSNFWYEEDYKEDLQQRCEKELKDPMSKIVFEERYVEVEQNPEVKILKPSKESVDQLVQVWNELQDKFDEVINNLV